MSLREEMLKYEQITGESAEHVPIIKLGAFLDGYDMGVKALEQTELNSSYNSIKTELKPRTNLVETSQDTISREALKQKLQDHHDFFVNAYGSYKDMTFKDKARVDEIDNCIAMVVNAPSVTPEPKVGKWIPCSERLPEEDETEVLITLKEDGSVLQATYLDDRTFDTEAYGWFAIKDISAWMLLPKPYEESEDKE